MKSIKTLKDVVDWRLCVGCGACASVCSAERVRLFDFFEEGIRPIVDSDDCGGCRECLDVCPAVETDFKAVDSNGGPSPVPLGDVAFREDWGQVIEVWEGYAADPEIRFKGSSGGVLTAISAYCLEQGGMHGVLHVAQHPADPLRNATRLSHSRAELIAATGSRYSPASVCDHLGWVEQAPAPCVVIGKPAEIVALRNAERLKPELSRNVGVALSFFCAESPATAGTVALLKEIGVPAKTVKDLRYRGFGWPGHFAPIQHGSAEPTQKMAYRDSWKFLQSYRPWAVHLWPDGTGELADISCGDPWYEKPDGANPGFSLVAVRTEKGRAIIKAAMEAGYLELTRAEPWKLAKSQQYLANKKAATWGRLLAMRLFGLPVPRFKNAHLLRCWMRLSVKEKLQSVAGTLRRIFRRKTFLPLRLNRATATEVPHDRMGRLGSP